MSYKMKGNMIKTAWWLLIVVWIVCASLAIYKLYKSQSSVTFVINSTTFAHSDAKARLLMIAETVGLWYVVIMSTMVGPLYALPKIYGIV